METVENQNWIVTISKEELSSLPAACFSGQIHLVDSEEDADYAVKTLRASDVIGFDTETKPSFKKGQVNHVALVQFSTREESFLFRVNHIGMPESLKSLIEDPDILKIGLSIHDDFHNLNKIFSIYPDGFIDLQSYVKNFRIADNSLSRIYALLFGKRISKSQRLTNWEAQELTVSQQTYAALDALACIQIYDYLNSGKFIPENSKYFRQAPQMQPAAAAQKND